MKRARKANEQSMAMLKKRKKKKVFGTIVTQINIFINRDLVCWPLEGNGGPCPDLGLVQLVGIITFGELAMVKRKQLYRKLPSIS